MGVTETLENITHKRAKRSALSQQVTTRLQGTDKHETRVTKRIHKRSNALERSVRKLLEGLNMFDGTNLTLISDVDQDIYFLTHLSVSFFDQSLSNILDTSPIICKLLFFNKLSS